MHFPDGKSACRRRRRRGPVHECRLFRASRRRKSSHILDAGHYRVERIEVGPKGWLVMKRPEGCGMMRRRVRLEGFRPCPWPEVLCQALGVRPDWNFPSPHNKPSTSPATWSTDPSSQPHHTTAISHGQGTSRTARLPIGNDAAETHGNDHPSWDQSSNALDGLSANRRPGRHEVDGEDPYRPSLHHEIPRSALRYTHDHLLPPRLTT